MNKGCIVALMVANIFGCLVCSLPVYSAEPATSKSIVKVLTDANAVKRGQDFSAKVNGESIVISTWDEQEKLTNKQCKVEAILISKILTDKFPDILCVETLFCSPFNKAAYRKVIVQQALLNAFGKGGIDDAQMLSTLNVINGTASPSEVADTTGKGDENFQGIELKTGPLRERRKDLLTKIRELDKKGVGIKPFVSAFKQIEDTVERDELGTIEKSLERLEHSVDEQTHALESAKTQKMSQSNPGNNDGLALNKVSVGNIKKTPSKGKVNRWALSFFPMEEKRILENPFGYWAGCVRKYQAKNNLKGYTPDCANAALWFAEVLKQNGRMSESLKFSTLAHTIEKQ